MEDLIAGDKVTVVRLAEQLKQANSHAQYQRIQCVLIRAALGSPAAEISQLLGWSTATVYVIHSRWAKEGDTVSDARARGGRRNPYLSIEQERARLKPFLSKAQAGGVLTVSEIQRVYEERTGKAVAPSTIYRLLDRHGWRKVVSRPRHPKADVAAQAAFKKLRRLVGPEVARQAECDRPVRLMFKSEGCFGLFGSPRRCWAPRGLRPVVGARLERKYIYAFGAVSPHDGVMDSLVLLWVNAETMSMFLAEVAQRHAHEFILMVVDQAG